jgi:hypothetical protein
VQVRVPVSTIGADVKREQVAEIVRVQLDQIGQNRGSFERDRFERDIFVRRHGDDLAASGGRIGGVMLDA